MLGALRRIPGAAWGILALGTGMLLGTLFPAQLALIPAGVKLIFGGLAWAAPYIIFFTISAAIVDMQRGGKGGRFALWVTIAFTIAGLFAALLAIVMVVPIFSLSWGAGAATGRLLGEGVTFRELVLAHLTPSLIAVLYAAATMILLGWLARFRWARWFARPTMDVVRRVGVDGIHLVGRAVKVAFPYLLFGIGIYIPTGTASALAKTSAGLDAQPLVDSVVGTNPVALYFLTVWIQIVVLAAFMTIVVAGACWYTGFSVKRFFKEYFLYVYPFAWATSSSAASIPVNLERTGSGLQVRKEVREFVIPLGATVNLDGAIMACFIITTMASLLVGYRPTFIDLLLLVIPIKLVTMGVPGIPGGIAAVVPPLVSEILPIPEDRKAAFLAIWFGFSVGLSDQFRTGVNTTTNGVVALLFEKLYPRWFSKGAPAPDPGPDPAPGPDPVPEDAA
jgi:Na+/H+-dicarboxylate symporter